MPIFLHLDDQTAIRRNPNRGPNFHRFSANQAPFDVLNDSDADAPGTARRARMPTSRADVRDADGKASGEGALFTGEAPICRGGRPFAQCQSRHAARPAPAAWRRSRIIKVARQTDALVATSSRYPGGYKGETGTLQRAVTAQPLLGLSRRPCSSCSKATASGAWSSETRLAEGRPADRLAAIDAVERVALDLYVVEALNFRPRK